jgi:hypothetical protein
MFELLMNNALMAAEKSTQIIWRSINQDYPKPLSFS